MPHYKCASCKTRLHAAMPDPGLHECPCCGARLQPVTDLSELVGCRSIVIGAGEDLWLDDGGAPPVLEAVAVALPLPPE